MRLMPAYNPSLNALKGETISGFPQVTLVLGGARSGKSRYAEQRLTQMPPPWVYIATAQAFDDEMRVRILEHRARRGAGWLTTEAPLDLAAAIATAAATAAAPVLVDCLTLWLTNLMLGDHDVEAAILGLEAVLGQRAAPSILVSNEVGFGIVPETPLGRRFRDAAGLLNQRIAARAQAVILTVAGLPLVIK